MRFQVNASRSNHEPESVCGPAIVSGFAHVGPFAPASRTIPRLKFALESAPRAKPGVKSRCIQPLSLKKNSVPDDIPFVFGGPRRQTRRGLPPLPSNSMSVSPWPP